MSELWRLDRLDTGERTALKRAAGTLALNAPALRAFYKADVCREAGWEEQRYAAMCMACLWNEQENPPVLSMQECLARMCWDDGELQEAMARRVEALLETRWSKEDDFLIGKLLNLVRMMKSKGEYRPDFEKLALALRGWNNENQYVQREWLRTIYRNGLATKAEADDQNKEEENDHDA